MTVRRQVAGTVCLSMKFSLAKPKSAPCGGFGNVKPPVKPLQGSVFGSESVREPSDEAVVEELISVQGDEFKTNAAAVPVSVVIECKHRLPAPTWLSAGRKIHYEKERGSGDSSDAVAKQMTIVDGLNFLLKTGSGEDGTESRTVDIAGVDSGVVATSFGGKKEKLDKSLPEVESRPAEECSPSLRREAVKVEEPARSAAAIHDDMSRPKEEVVESRSRGESDDSLDGDLYKKLGLNKRRKGDGAKLLLSRRLRGSLDEGGTLELKKELEMLPDVDKYAHEKIKIDDFGMAMLVGMGFDPASVVAEPDRQALKRVWKGEGLGAHVEMKANKSALDRIRAAPAAEPPKSQSSRDTQHEKCERPVSADQGRVRRRELQAREENVTL